MHRDKAGNWVGTTRRYAVYPIDMTNKVTWARDDGLSEWSQMTLWEAYRDIDKSVNSQRISQATP